MAWDARTTYYYLVCFVTLMMVIFGTVQAVRNTLDLVFPEEPYRPSVLEMRQRGVAGPRVEGPRVEAERTYTDEELRQLAEEEAEQQGRQQRRRALRNLLGNLVLLGVAVPVYVYHWRRVRQE